MKLLFDLPFDEYKKIEAMNHSSLKNLYPPNTPLDFWWHQHHPRKPSGDMDFGSAVHIAIFEHEKFDESVAIAPECDRRTKSGKAEYQNFVDSAVGKIILTQEQVDSCYNIIDACQNHAVLAPMLKEKSSKFEVSGIFEYKDVPLKFRTDFLIMDERIILDLKTTKAGHERAFQRSVFDFCYHSQAAFYMLGLQEILGEVWSDFYWIALESNPPHKIYLYQPDVNWLMHGMVLIDNAIDLYKECIKNNLYPGVSPEIKILNTPKWIGEIE